MRISRAIVSDRFNALTLLAPSLAIRENKTLVGLQDSAKPPGKTFSGSKRFLSGSNGTILTSIESNSLSRAAEKTSSVRANILRSACARTTQFWLYNKTVSSDRYCQPAEASCAARFDLPLPEGPVTRTPSPPGLTTPAACNSYNPHRRIATIAVLKIRRAKAERSRESALFPLQTSTLDGLPGPDTTVEPQFSKKYICVSVRQRPPSATSNGRRPAGGGRGGAHRGNTK